MIKITKVAMTVVAIQVVEGAEQKARMLPIVTWPQDLTTSKSCNVKGLLGSLVQFYRLVSFPLRKEFKENSDPEVDRFTSIVTLLAIQTYD
jgi:hypothetical protein